MQWTMRLLRTLPSVRAMTAMAVTGILSVASCVSLSPPSGSGSVPVVGGRYKNGRDQVVRIALATAAREGADLGSGRGPLVIRPESNNPFVVWNGKRYRGELVVTAADSGMLVVNRLPMD